MRRLCILVMMMLMIVNARSAGVQGVGRNFQLPKEKALGTKIEAKVWQWHHDDATQRKVVADLSKERRIPISAFQTTAFSVKFVVPALHDTIYCRFLNTDCGNDEWTFGPASVTNYDGDMATREYRAFVEYHAGPPAVGQYSLEVKAELKGKAVADTVVQFEIYDDRVVPDHTTFLKGKTDFAGNPITCSTPVDLTKLNETPRLKDNDYPFEPQKAYTTINYERFPPFSLPPRFVNIWHSWRFAEEPKMGGPLNRGFNATTVIDPAQDGPLKINQRVSWHTPDHQVAYINKWYSEDPKRFHDLKGYAEYRSAFVSASNAFMLGYECYGEGSGIYGWDEEQMWYTIAETLVKEHPEYVPADVLALAKDDPKVEKDETKQRLHDAYIKAWGDFIANTYLGAKAHAAKKHTDIKIWHYGSKSVGSTYFHNRDDAKIDPATGIPVHELPGNLWRWFKTGGRDDGKLDFKGTPYASVIDFWAKDFYYWTLLPEHNTMYEKKADGQYVLEDDGRRKIRRDLFEEVQYNEPVKIGYDDPAVACMFLKKFIAMGEDSLFWFNGGKYYKTRGTVPMTKQLMPAVRPGNQETWPGDTIPLGSRPISPYMAEAVPIFTYMIGLESLYLWDAGFPMGKVGYGRGEDRFSLGQLEYLFKGMHRVSNFNKLFEGKYSFVRPNRVSDTWNRDNALLIRGIINGRHLVLAMTNPYLDPGESMNVELWYDTSYTRRGKAVWKDKVTVHAKKNSIFQCKLPPLPKGYDPDKLYIRYTLKDGNYTKQFTLTGNWNVAYPHKD